MPAIPRVVLLVWISTAMLAACEDGATPSDADGAGGAAGDAVSGLTIQPFAQPAVTLTVNQTHEQSVMLNTPAGATTLVQVQNLHARNVSVAPSSLLFSPGEQQRSVTLTALEQTQGVFVPITFQIVPSGPSRTLEVMVKLW